MENINKVVRVSINNHVFSIKMEEEVFVFPIEIHNQNYTRSESSMEEDDLEMDDVPFFLKEA